MKHASDLSTRFSPTMGPKPKTSDSDLFCHEVQRSFWLVIGLCAPRDLPGGTWTSAIGFWRHSSKSYVLEYFTL